MGSEIKWEVTEYYAAYVGPQRSPTWYEVRKGRITASNAAAAMGISEYTTKDKLIDRVKHNKSLFKTAAMQHGIDHEDEVREWYCRTRGVVVRDVGFAYAIDAPRLGVSTDGLVGDDGIIEIKCPYSGMYPELANPDLTFSHIKRDHYAQMQMGMGIYRRRWCDYIVADLRTGGGPRYYVERIPFNYHFWLACKYNLISFADEYLSDKPLLTIAGLQPPSTPARVLTLAEIYQDISREDSPSPKVKSKAKSSPPPTPSMPAPAKTTEESTTSPTIEEIYRDISREEI